MNLVKRKPAYITFWVVLSLFIFNSCVDEQKAPIPNTISAEHKKLEDLLNFHTIPISDSVLEFQFDLIETYEFKNIFLMQGKDTLSKGAFFESGIFREMKDRVRLSYDFDPEQEYYFLVEATDYFRPNTRFAYTLPSYQHISANDFSFQPLLEIDRMVEYDFSPSRDFLFLSELSNNEYSIHRLDLKNTSMTTLFDKNKISGNLIRATSDHEFLFSARPENPQNPDWMALRKIDIRTGQSRELANYNPSRLVSHIVKNILVVDETGGNSFKHHAINVQTGESTDLGNFNSSINPERLDQLIIGNFKILPENLEKVEIRGTDPKLIFLYASQSGYNFYSVLGKEPTATDTHPYRRLQVYKNDQLIFEVTDESLGTAILFQNFDVVDDIFTYFKMHHSNNQYKVDGFYTVDLRTGEEVLRHADYSNMVLNVFDFGPKGIITERNRKFSFLKVN